MRPTKVDIQTVQQFHQAGLLEAAKDGYLSILKEQPKNPDILHALGVVSAQMGDFTAAVDYFQKAITLQPQNPVLYLNLGNALKILGLFSHALQVFHTAIDLNPHYHAALNNLGTVYYSLGKMEEAIQYFELAIQKQPDYIEAYYNLALAQTKQQKTNEAIETYETLITYAPENSAAHFQLGCLLLQQNNLHNAIISFLTVEKIHPNHFETQTNLATCYLKQGAMSQAKTHYIKALQLAPDDTQILFNLGVINMQQGHTDSAIQHYQRALQIDPNFFAAHNNLGVAFLSKQHIGFALHHFREALRLEPHNEAVAYTVQMLAQDDRLLASPPAYIKNLFDSYADHYELHLLHGLEYKVPELLLNAVNTTTNKPAIDWDILDLGCGTGLCGIHFKPLAKTMTGIDLSPKMLEIAAQKNIYDALIPGELQEGLLAKESAYDLILAGDVFVYVGELDAIFKGAAAALKPSGLFVFNTEITDSEDYTMNQSGRFSHRKEYLEHLAHQFGLSVLKYEHVITRQQNNAPAYGHLFVLQRQ